MKNFEITAILNSILYIFIEYFNLQHSQLGKNFNTVYNGRNTNILR